MFLEGNLKKYKQVMKDFYGEEVFIYLDHLKSRQSVYTALDLVELIEHYKACNKLIRKIKKRNGSVPIEFFKLPAEAYKKGAPT